MPQMAPLNWLTLMIFFVLILVIFNGLNYFSFTYIPKTETSVKKQFTLNWKW
uniref:ATP synthase complex subunit 8 n=1 Tax=Tenebrionoidea sp. 13 KM-2017 TaxID=2219468 RepID=A0A346RFQ0_9CUCU|nr:ATP synthase F0 subunit 8 [Tenebrionoidea sp. 13 KM-2017]